MIFSKGSVFRVICPSLRSFFLTEGWTSCECLPYMFFFPSFSIFLEWSMYLVPEYLVHGCIGMLDIRPDKCIERIWNHSRIDTQDSWPKVDTKSKMTWTEPNNIRIFSTKLIFLCKKSFFDRKSIDLKSTWTENDLTQTWIRTQIESCWPEWDPTRTSSAPNQNQIANSLGLVDLSFCRRNYICCGIPKANSNCTL